MDISGASDTDLDGLSGAFNLAFPVYGRDCDENDNGYGMAADMFKNENEGLGSVYTKKVNLKMDTGPRHSGSPVYYCPGGGNGIGCAGSEEGQIIAIMSGFNGFETTSVGPKGPSFRAWALDIMDNNP